MREQRAVNSIAFTILVVGLILVLFRCADGPVTLPDREFAVTTTAPPAEPVPPPPAPPVNECDVVGVNQAGVRWSVAGSVLSLFVPVSPAFGEPYVNVWHPELNHQLLSRCPAEKVDKGWESRCDVRLPGRGPWSIRLAVETIDSNDKIYQCDRLHFDVPPPPPPSTTTTVPSCKYEPVCETWIDHMRDDWVKAHWRACNYTGEVVLRRKWAYGDRTKRVSIDVGCECVEGARELDTKGPGYFEVRCEP